MPPTLISAKKKSTMLSVPAENPLVPGHWSQRPWLRIVMGILVTQGLFLFLRRCVEAYHLLRIGDHLAPLQQFQAQLNDWFALVVECGQIQPLRNAWHSENGFFLWQGLQVVALLLGGILAGAGQKASWQYGGLIGLINGFISLIQLLPYQRQVQVPELFLYGQPLLYVVVGITASLIGAWIWPPLIAASIDDLRHPKEVVKPSWWDRLRALFDFSTLRVHWGRCLLCAVVAAVGIVFMRAGYLWVRDKLGLADFLYKRGVQNAQVTAMLYWLWVFLCAMAAGASTRHGWIQGFWVGLVSAVVLIVVNLNRPDQVFDVAEIPLSFATFLALGVTGGSFGARLLPPVLKQIRTTPRMTGI